MSRVGWLDCSSGVSGDMLLGALSALGAVDVGQLAAGLGLGVTVTVSPVQRGPLAATHVDVQARDGQPHRRLGDVLDVLAAADVDDAVRERATAVFRRLAAAEAQVHGINDDDVEFHEVGAVDAIVDVIGCCAGLDALHLDRLVVAPIALGGGTTRTAHGQLPVPVPAVLALLQGAGLTAYGGPVPVELATPTGVAVLAEYATDSGPMPPLQVEGVGIGAGTRELPDRANVLRVVVGATTAQPTEGWQLLEANVDDLDPRVWPVVLERLLSAGAADAWLTPILMKKGRPAHTLGVLCADDAVDAVARVVFAESSTIGLRTTAVGKRELDREWTPVDVSGQTVRVKLARLDGELVNAAPEFDDVVRAATALGRPVKAVLAAAIAAARAQLP